MSCCTIVHAVGRRMVNVREAIVFNADDGITRKKSGVHDFLFTLGDAGRDEYGS